MTTAPERIPERTASRRYTVLVAAAAVVVMVVVGGFLAFRDDGGGGGTDVAAVELTAGPSDSLSSCLALDPAFLADMPLAFKGTVQAVEGDQVTLGVDRWYKGGDAEAVHITAPQGLEALLGAVDFVVGESYLVSATDGVVNYCGFSGPATPELQGVYDAAFGA
jgi:hypothetical protein